MAEEEPLLKPIGESLWAVWPSRQITLEFSRFADHRDTLSAEVSIVSALGPLHWARVNLASTQGRNALIRAAEEASGEDGWRPVIDRSCQLVARRFRESEPAAALVAAPRSSARWFVEPVMPAGDISVLFGDGGAGKSLLALALALGGVLGHPVGGWRVASLTHAMYLDWESDARSHGERLWGLTRALEPPPEGAILHRRLYRPLTEDLATIRADCDRCKADLVVVDSFGAACGPEPEGADAALRTLMAIRSLPGTKLVIAHVSKVSAEQTRSRPFGSVYVQNLPRSTIEARAQETVEAGEDLRISLYHRKSNVGPLARPSAVMFSWGIDESITITRADPDLKSAGLGPQILAALRHGAQTVTDIAEEIDAGRASVKTTLNRLENRNKVVRLVTASGGRGKKAQWGLVDESRNIDNDIP